MSMHANSYQLFSKEILSIWKNQDVSYIKVEELSTIEGITFFELIPDSELLDGGEQDTLYAIDSDDVEDMLLFSKNIRFVVHNIYLEED
ncbi:MAG: hypothetical protein K0R59_1805 [Sphingobacterium sp.]|uniref:hypothetical protein n=1 Tax=Sphingobacterium sp. CZ-UAM TaxID=1933868 RepID=UPI000984CB0A|nr:hypothetical protein [Sphingobacterium sp. CZ-UAM]MDF2516509.1 hypothetical protein [Sphingobacterium sp.]OOG18998.1 hypothetical protein BWD42_03315 [Sphingobacterium sp. CZ-UAM]